MSTPVEIERKYVIRMPDISIMRAQTGYTVSEIHQTYLTSHAGVTHRVRMRVFPDKIVYTETKKVRIDAMSAYEDEREISEDEYLELIGCIAPDTHTLTKSRHTFTSYGQTFEVDIYPEWTRTCILETELSSRDETVTMPDFISVVKEVTGDKKYSNASMSREFPVELI